MEPYIVSMSPMNDTFSVPPLTYIDLVFNENIKFGRPGAALLIAVTTRKASRSRGTAEPSVSSLQYLITLPNNASSLKKVSAPFLPSTTVSSRLTGHASALGEERRRTEAKLGTSPSFGKRARESVEDDPHVEQSSLLTGFGTTPVGTPQTGTSISGASLNSTSQSNKWTVEIIGQKLRITPDKDATSLPLGDYRVGIEFGFVTDLIGNMNKGATNLTFTLATDANCPFLYVTGFTTENGNCNGLYLPADPMNDQASWQGGEKNAFFIYWKKEVREGGKVHQGGNWIVDTNYDESSFLAFADLTEHADKKGGRNGAHPPSGLWHKWTGSSRRAQPHISMFCALSPDRSPASLTSVNPLIGSSLPLSTSSLLPLRPITLTFNKPMNFGHWATIKLIPRRLAEPADSDGEKAGGAGSPIGEKGVVVWIPDVEGNMRGETIKIFNRPAREVVARALAAVPTLASLGAGDEQSERDDLPGEVGNAGNSDASSATPPAQSPSSSASWALLRASSARRLQANASASLPAARAALENLVGVVELHVTEPLIPGETYDLVAELGSLTDLAYNPWGPVEKGTLVFHTTGGRCASNVSDGNLVFFPSVESSPPASLTAVGSHRPSKRDGGQEEREEGGYFLAEKGREILGLHAGAGKEGADDGTEVRVVCRQGFSVHASLKGSKDAEETQLTCEDGRWKSYKSLPKCFASCGPFPLLPGGAYVMGGDVGGDGIEGESLDIRCSESAEILSPISRQTVECRNGKWDALRVKCGATCAPLGPILGPRYRVFMQTQAQREQTSLEGDPEAHAFFAATTPSARAGTGARELGSAKALENREAKEGEMRTVVCAPGTSRVPDQTREHAPFSAAPSSSRGTRSAKGDSGEGEEALCGKSGWSKLLVSDIDTRFEVRFSIGFVLIMSSFLRLPDLRFPPFSHSRIWASGSPCSRAPQTVRLFPVLPGAFSGFLPSAATRLSFTTTCEDGRWQPLSPPPRSSSPLCVPRCPSLDLPPNAYSVSPLPDAIGPDGALQQRLEVTCAPQAVSVGSETRQEMVCSRGGVWSLLTVQCQAPCSFPLLQLGDRYELHDQEEHRGPRATVSQRSSGVSPAPRGSLGTSDAAGDDVYKHGTELMIGCASGAAADGGGAASAPHKIVCRDGLWKSAYRVMAAGPGTNIGTRAGVGTPGGSSAALSGDPVRGNVSGPNGGGLLPNGVYTASAPSPLPQAEVELKCRRGCGVPALPPEFRPLFLAPRVALLQRWHHEQQLQISCAKGFSADPRRHEANVDNYETLVCRDGEWHSLHSSPSRKNGGSRSSLSSPTQASIPGLQLACHRGCEASEIRRAAQLHHFDLPASFGVSGASPPFPTASLPHGGTLAVSCQPQVSVLAGPTSGASLLCKNGSVALPHTVCGQPSCTDGVQNGDETGVDCGGSCAPCLSCSDGLQNNGETGVDCGGPCPACSACAPPLPSQLFAPGVEPDLEALGALLVLPPALSPDADGMGPERAAISNLRPFLPFSDLLTQMRSDFSSSAGGLPPGSALHLHCRHANGMSHQVSAATGQWAVFRCLRGQWLAASGRHGAHGASARPVPSALSGGPSFFSCPKPTCADGVRNGDETGVDCGGSCPKKCPSCFNGMRDGDEEDVDCGGSVCEPCEFCSPRPLKEFLASRELFLVKRPGPQNKAESSAFEKHVDRLLTDEGIVSSVLTKPGQQLQVKCKSRSGDEGLLVQCRNGIWALASPSASVWTSPSFSAFFASSRGTGMWWPKQAADARQALTAFRLACVASHADATAPLEGTGISALDLASSASSASAASFSASSTSSSLPAVPLTWRIGGALATFAVPDIGVTREGSAHPPCISRLLEVFRSSLRGECGALAFGSSALKLSSFCSNSCTRALKSALAGALGDLAETGDRDPRDGDSDKSARSPFHGCASAEDGLLAKKIALLLRELLATWCAQQNGMYCFAEAATSFHFLRNLYSQAEASPAFFQSELKGHCPANSCFRSNVKHVLLLAELSDLVDIRLPAYFAGSLGKEASAGPGASRALRRAAYSQRRRRRLGATGGATPGTDAGDEAAGDTPDGKAGTHMELEGMRQSEGEHTEKRQESEEGGDGDGKLAETGDDLEEVRIATASVFSPSSFASPALSAGQPRRLFPASLSSSAASALVRVDLRQRASSSSGVSGNRSAGSGQSSASLAAPRFASRGTQGFLEDIRNTLEILDLLCIEVNGQLCVEDVLQVGTRNPVFASPSGNDEGAQTICRKDSCLLEVTRVFGQMLIDAADRQTQNFFEKRIFHMPPTAGGKRDALAYNRVTPRSDGNSAAGLVGRRGEGSAQSSGVQAPEEGGGQPSTSDFHPYDVVLGVLMKHWGRTFCHRNIRGSLCGGYVFPSALDTALAEQSRGSYVPTENEKKYRVCTCPHTLIGDGDCDLQCFNEACGWDAGDCLATEVLFPVYRHLVNQLGTEIADVCNPFNARFSCDSADASTSRSASSSSHRNCSHHFTLGTASAASPSSASLGGSLRQRREAKEGKNHEDDHPRVAAQLWKGDIWIQVDRSSTFFEFACKRQLDRTCSRGLNRFAYAVDMKITNVDLDSVLQSPSASEALPQISGLPTASPGASSPPSSPLLASSSRVYSSSASADGEGGGRASGSAARERSLALATTLSPRHTELRRVLREEIASLLAVPVGDVVEMRLWRGSIDVAAVVDPGWLANTARFKDRLQSLTENPESPLSLVTLLSSALTRHFTSASRASHASPLLAVLPTLPAPRLLASLREDAASPISLSPVHTKISQIPFQTALPPSLPSAASHPLFGAFGVAELPVISRVCVGTQGLQPPEGTSVYDAYKIWANSGRGGVGNEHGSTMVVECNAGHEAVEGEAPQTLVCNQGRWEPLPPVSPRSLAKESHHRILVCRRPCQPYEKIDPAVMRPEFIVSGYGTSDGDARTVLCAPGYSPRDVETSGATETIECVNGEWQPVRRLLCEKDFAALSGSTSSPCSGALSGLEESYRLTEVPLLPSANPDVSPDLATALKIRLQPHGTTVQVFKVACARGYTHAPTQSGGTSAGALGAGTSQGVSSGNAGRSASGEVYLACLDGGLVGLGSQELFPLGGSAEGHRAEALAEDFTERLRKATPVKLPSRSHAHGLGNGSDREDALAGHGRLSRERPASSPGLASSFSEELSDIQKSLVCLRDVRLDPPLGTKPLSDTAMVFLCLLILFVLVVALIAGWWLRNARKKRKSGKLAGRETGKNLDGDPEGDEDAEVESKRNLDFKRRTTGETVMMDGTVMVSGAGAEQFLANYLFGTGGAKLLPAGDASGRSRDGLPPGAVVLGRLKEPDLVAAQMYIDQAHAETSPSFAKPSELLTSATAAMVLGSTDAAHQAFLLLQHQQQKTRGQVRGTKTDRELSQTNQELGSHPGARDLTEAGEEGDERREGNGGATTYSLSPIYLAGLPGDSESVQDVREQSTLEEESQTTAASQEPRASVMSVDQHQQLHALLQQPGRNLGLHVNEAEGERYALDPQRRHGTGSCPAQCLRTRDVFASSLEQRYPGVRSQSLPQHQNKQTARQLHCEQTLVPGKHLSGWPAAKDDESVDEEDDVEVLDVDTRLFGPGSPSRPSHHPLSNALSTACVHQQPRYREAYQVSGTSQDRDTGETANTTEGEGECETAHEVNGGVQRTVRQGVCMWGNGADCKQYDSWAAINSRMRSSSGPRGSCASRTRPTPATERRHSLHLQHRDLQTNSNNEETSALETQRARYGGAVALQDPTLQAQPQMLFSSQSDDELYPDDSASCVGQLGYRLGRGLGPMLLTGLHRSVAENGARSEPSASPRFVNELPLPNETRDVLRYPEYARQGPLAANPSWSESTAGQDGGRRTSGNGGKQNGSSVSREQHGFRG
uniref:Sushi domain (Scr repeat) domain-containing protein n=1 Tax=Neospora caninum (strain Liverpool) TaxID=572307 RepID=A0A0F7U8C5_NEOCL|nr:TPA: sushi domain (scr repeat) domain-containing protein [Neospora caninum Liverpool]